MTQKSSFDSFHLKTETGHRNPGRDCEIYAKINEADGATVTICSGDIRYKHVYTTISNSVEVQIIKAGESGDESHYFAITYQGMTGKFQGLQHLTVVGAID